MAGRLLQVVVFPYRICSSTAISGLSLNESLLKLLKGSMRVLETTNVPKVVCASNC